MVVSALVERGSKGRVARLGAAVLVLGVSVLALLALSPDSSPRTQAALDPEMPPMVASDAPVLVASEASAPAQSTAAALRRITAVKAAPEPSLNDVTNGLMVELGLRTADGAPEQDALKSMSANALSGIRAITGKAAEPVALNQPPSLQTIVAQALRDGKSDAYIDALVNEAVGKGEVTAPSALITVDGRVDTHILLAGLVSQASKDAGIAQAPVVAGGEGVEVRIVQKADGATEQHHFYTVNPGDSLGAIAHRFYGDASRYMDIYQANKMIVSSPDKIRVGQRLVVPNA